MKKVIVSILFFFFLSTSYAQENFGVFAGLNYSYFTDGFMEKTSAERSFGLHIGFLYNLSITDKVVFRPKLFFSQQGDRTTTTQQSHFFLGQIDSKVNYINLGLDLKYGDKTYLILGQQIGFLTSQTKESANLIFINKDFDFGINLGIGFKVHILFVELGIYQGLTTLVQVPESFSTGVANVKNGYARLTIGYNF